MHDAGHPLTTASAGIYLAGAHRVVDACAVAEGTGVGVFPAGGVPSESPGRLREGTSRQSVVTPATDTSLGWPQATESWLLWYAVRTGLINWRAQDGQEEGLHPQECPWLEQEGIAGPDAIWRCPRTPLGDSTTASDDRRKRFISPQVIVREGIQAEHDHVDFSLIGSIELGVSWLHSDVRNCDRLKTYRP